LRRNRARYRGSHFGTEGASEPSTYSDSIYKLGEYNLIPDEFAHKFVYISGLRNFLAHDYQRDTIPVLEKFLKYGIKDVRYFLKAVESLL
jgi:uncharacterized protein YutE (UPF0331/DUF86 family)